MLWPIPWPFGPSKVLNKYTVPSSSKKQGRGQFPLAHPNRVRPFSSDIVCPHIKIPFAAHIGCHHRNGLYGNEWSEPKFLGMAGSVPAAAGIPGSAHSRFVPNGSGHRCETGERREKLKGAGHKIIIVSHPADAGIGIKPGNNRIIIFHFLSSFCSHISVIKTSEAA